jgi:purine-nucleoside phosphorylase
VSDALSGQVNEAVAAVRAAIGERRPAVGVILGSGLGRFADTLEDAATLPYGRIPHFPVSNVVGHSGKLVAGRVGKTEVLAMAGRVHYYEGHDVSRVVFPVRVLIAAGVRTLIITNAAGGVNPSYRAGDLVLIRDHLNLLGANPLRGANDDRLGPRFPDMSEAYPAALRAFAAARGREQGLELAEGIYACLSGPAYETPAEVRMLGILGADLAGMSTVPEVIAAVHMGARVLGISCVTNQAAGIAKHKLSHAEVTETAERVRPVFVKLLGAILAGIGDVA